MKREIIKRQLENWFDEMLQKYAWLNIKYEYSDIERCFLVSFSPGVITKASEDFSKDALEFENKMNAEYDTDAPLFCDDESLFKLSSNAMCISNSRISTFTSEFSTNLAQFNLSDGISSNIADAREYAEEFCYTSCDYDIAA